MKKNEKIGAVIGTAVIIGAVLLGCSFTTVKSGEIGLKTRFGKITQTSMSEGVNFKIPLDRKSVV